MDYRRPESRHPHKDEQTGLASPIYLWCKELLFFFLHGSLVFLLGNQSLVSPAGPMHHVVFPSFSHSHWLIFLCLHAGLIGSLPPPSSSSPSCQNHSRGIALLHARQREKKLSTRFSVLQLPVWAHYSSAPSAVRFIIGSLKQFVLLWCFKEMWLGMCFPQPARWGRDRGNIAHLELFCCMWAVLSEMVVQWVGKNGFSVSELKPDKSH